MATKDKKAVKKAGEPFLKDRTTFFSDLSYMRPQLKNAAWASQMLYFMYKNGRLFLNPKRAEKYRGLDALEIDEGEYKRMFDPVTPMDSGGTASYVSADWKQNPIYIHLKNVVKAEIQRTSKQLEVNCNDKYAKTRKMRDNYRILYRNLFRQIINELITEVMPKGTPLLKESQDPYKWASNFYQSQDKEKKKGNDESDVVDSYVDLIKNKIADSQDLALYNELLYKGDYEVAFEKGIQYYLMDLNKWNERWSDEFIDDIMHFNKACGEWYTDLVTGRPVVERFVPERLWTSPFKRKDGEDLMYYRTEYEITFGDFVKTIGANLDPQKLKEVFEYQKTQGSCHGATWVDIDGRQNRYRDDAMIRVGRAACLTQDYDVDMDAIKAMYPNISNSDLSWYTGDEKLKLPQSTKHYNVWYSWYYIPPSTFSLSNADYAWQSNFIFQLKKNQDQFRYGEDGRFSKSPLVIYDNGKQASFTDIVQYWMPKINFASMQYQNCLINDIEASILSEELIGGLLQAVDEDNNINPGNPDEPTGGNGRNAFMEQWKMIKQRSTGFLKFTDKQGKEIIDPAKLQMVYKNGQMERAERFMGEMIRMYGMLTQSLAMSDAREGMDTKSHTTVAAIEETLKSSNNATWFITKAYEEFLKMYAERIIRFIIEIVKEAKEYGYTKRLDEFKDIIGMANGLAVEGMEDVPPESVGMDISYVDNSAKKDFVMQLAVEYVKGGKLNEDFVYLIMGVDNWKQAFILLRMGIKAMKKEEANERELAQKYAMQQKQADLQIALAQQQAKDKGRDQNIMTQGQVDAMLEQLLAKLKTDSQKDITDKRTEGRVVQDTNKADLKEKHESQKPFQAAQPASA